VHGVPLVKAVGLDHIVLRCADIEASLDFYCDMLGLEGERVDAWRRGEAPFPSVRITPETIIDLFGPAPDGTNLDHFCLVIEPTDLDALAAAFPDSHRADKLFGAQGAASSLYVNDPDGNTVELRSYQERRPRRQERET
jgi:catechol 2,3-dioxygenase-like lactoylglutathione lyase family enzyme